MRQFWPSILLLFISQAFLFNYSHSQTTLIVASSKASKPCDNPPCDPVISDPINSGSHSEVGLISTCYQADSASGIAQISIEFQLNSLLLPSNSQTWMNYNYALDVFAYDIANNPLPVLSINDFWKSSTPRIHTHQAGVWYPVIHWDSSLGAWAGLTVIEVDNSNNQLASGFISLDFQVAYLHVNNPTSASTNSFVPLGSVEKVMGGTECELGNQGASTLRQSQTLNDLSKETFSLYPNPAVNSFSIISGQKEKEEMAISIYDINGKHLYEKTIAPISLNDTWAYKVDGIDFLNKGIYFVEVKNDSQRELMKLIIQ